MDIASIIGIADSLGIGVLIFFIWMQSHKSTHLRFEQILSQQAERERKNYELLREMIEETKKHAEAIARLEEKMSFNWFCPLVQEKLRNKDHGSYGAQ